tara:strand:+ start:2612 stop:3049 length:438 start_codon:yes stop_codon:yes gene_type:complete
MIYDASIPLDALSASNKLNALISDQKRFEIKEKRERKSISSKNYLHLILGWAAINFGYTLEEMKLNIFKAEVNPEIFYQGEVGTLVKVHRFRSISELTPQELNISISEFKKYMLEKGLYLPEPKDMALLQDIEKELNNYNERKSL